VVCNSTIWKRLFYNILIYFVVWDLDSALSTSKADEAPDNARLPIEANVESAKFDELRYDDKCFQLLIQSCRFRD